jgi:hypothetical protein
MSSMLCQRFGQRQDAGVRLQDDLRLRFGTAASRERPRSLGSQVFIEDFDRLLNILFENN